jgi:hypothetical protein
VAQAAYHGSTLKGSGTAIKEAYVKDVVGGLPTSAAKGVEDGGNCNTYIGNC